MTTYERVLLLEKKLKDIKRDICCMQEGGCPNISADADNIIECRDDGLYVSGTDSFSDYVLYVDKQFDGVASATITSTGITSTNAEYNAQLSSALVGSIEFPYPCIWSAQLEAKALTAVDGKKYTIKVIEGNVFTIGSPTLTENGDQFADASTNEEADIKVANVAADLLAASIGQHNITYIFGENSGIINICKTYTIRLIDLAITSDPWDTRIVGKGFFHWLYGSVEGFGCQLIRSADVVNLKLVFQGYKALVNRFAGVTIEGFQEINIDFDYWWEYATQMNIYGTDDWVTAGREQPVCIINIRDRRYGIDLFPGLPAGDPTHFGGTHRMFQAYGGYYSITYDRFLANEFSSQDGLLLRWQSDCPQATNNTMIFHIKEFIHTYIGGAATVQAGLLRILPSSTPAVNTNNRIEFNFGYVTSMGTFGDVTNNGLLFNMNNSVVVLNVSGLWTNTSSINSAINIGFSAVANVNNQQIFKGNYESTGGGLLVTARGTGAVATANSIAFQFKNCEFIQKVALFPAMDFLSKQTNMNVFLDNVKIVNDGVTELISKDVTNAPMSIFSSNVWTNNATISANLAIVGDALKTNAMLGNVLLR